MPDALPPVGVLLSALDAATLPLAGTETTFVMQGGQPKHTPVSSIGGGVYARSGTYTPSVTASASATVAPFLDAGYSRVGNGAGVPSAGDTVTMSVFINASNLVDGEVVTVDLPFEADPSVAGFVATPIILGSTSDLVARAALATATTMTVAFTVVGEDGGIVSLFATYQTANAVDP